MNKPILPLRSASALMLAGLALLPAFSFAQAPAAAPAAAPAPTATPPTIVATVAPNIIGLPGASNAQNAAVAEIESAILPILAEVGAARSALTFATYGDPTNSAGIQAKAEEVRAAEEKMALARAQGFAAIQASPNKLNSEQVRVLIWQGIRPEGGRRVNYGGRRGGPPPVATGAGGDGFAGLGVNNRGGLATGPEPVRMRDVQLTEVMRLNEVPAVEKLVSEVRAAKRAVVTQIYQDKLDEAALKAKVAAWAAAEGKLAEAKAVEFVKFQATSPLKLSADQVTTLATWNINAKQGL